MSIGSHNGALKGQRESFPFKSEEQSGVLTLIRFPGKWEALCLMISLHALEHRSRY